MIPIKDQASKIVNHKLETWFVGTVEDHEDPEQLGRVKVRVPELYGSIPVAHIPWANPALPWGGSSDYGMFYVPIPGSKVRIKLWRGHPWFPEWYGVHWFRSEPPEESQITPPHNYVIKTPNGHLIDLHDDAPYIRIKDLNGNYVIIDTSGDDLKIFIQNDRLEQTGGNSDETVGRGKRFDVGTRFDIKCGGPVNIRADGVVAIDAPTIHLNSNVAQPETPKKPEDVSHEV